MLKTQSLIMAATIRASIEGFVKVDEARRKKGWTKTEEAWADLATTSIATLRRFWVGMPIQLATFQKICDTVGIIDWETVADFENIVQSSPKVYEKRLSFAIAGSIEEIDKHKLNVIVALLRKLGGDTEVEILDIDEGSIKLILGGSPEALERIEALFKSGELTEISKISVEDVHFVEQDELAQLIRKNGGALVNLSGANLSGVNLSQTNLSQANLSQANLSQADLSGANLREANLSGANLREVNLSQASLNQARVWWNLWLVSPSRFDLIRADLSGADLSGADLSGADLSGANLSEADLTRAVFRNNLGLSESDKADMQARGAIFQDSPGSDVPSLVRR